MSASYEDVLGLVAELKPAKLARERDVRWVTDDAVVGLARAHDGRTEIFLSGERLDASSPVIREVLEYQTWYRSHGVPEIVANRLVLPAVGHFDQVAAFIATELLRSGADADLATAFRRTEPIIELAIERLRLSDQALLGLAGELLLLDALLDKVSSGEVGAVVSGWNGWRESHRDLVIGVVGVEIKTTTYTSSTHQVQGVHQVELSQGVDEDVAEEQFFLVSIGLQWSDQDASFRIPVLVDSILRRLHDAGRPDLAEIFMARVREYGAGAEVGYDHSTMSGDQRFTRGFSPRFVRSYDMSDPAIRVLRTGDIASFQHVDPRSVRFRIQLPDRVSGDVNPIWGLHDVASSLLAARSKAGQG